MKKIFGIFIISMSLGVMFAGCDTKEVAVENDVFVPEGVVETATTEDIIVEDVIADETITEDVIVEETITEDVIIEEAVTETVWVSPEYLAEMAYNSRQNEH